MIIGQYECNRKKNDKRKSKVFKIKKSDAPFTFKIKKKLTLNNIIEKAYSSYNSFFLKSTVVYVFLLKIGCRRHVHKVHTMSKLFYIKNGNKNQDKKNR